MRLYTAKILELAGMVIVFSGLLYGISHSLIRFELMALGIGSGIFYIGYLLEKRSI